MFFTFAFIQGTVSVESDTITCKVGTRHLNYGYTLHTLLDAIYKTTQNGTNYLDF